MIVRAIAKPIVSSLSNGRYNFCTRTEEFDQAVWAKTAMTIGSNAGVSPDGATTADKLIETATTAQHVVAQSASVSGVAGDFYTLSIFAKSAERSRFIFQTDTGGFGSSGTCEFNLGTGVAGSPSGSMSAPVIQSVGNGWFRCSVVVRASASHTTGVHKIVLVNGSGSSNYLGDGTSGLLVWGAQIERGVSATAYQAVRTASDFTPVFIPRD